MLGSAFTEISSLGELPPKEEPTIAKRVKYVIALLRLLVSSFALCLLFPSYSLSQIGRIGEGSSASAAFFYFNCWYEYLQYTGGSFYTICYQYINQHLLFDSQSNLLFFDSCCNNVALSAGKMASHMPQVKNEVKEEGMLYLLHRGYFWSYQMSLLILCLCI